MTAARNEAQMRRDKIVAEIKAKTGIDEAMIERLVHRFYDKVRADEFIGPVFDERIDDWGPHLDRMCEFWSSVVLMSGRYHGSPMQKHMPLPIGQAHFARWLELFRATAQEECPPAAAELFVDRAERIAESLQLGMGAARGELPSGPARRM